LLTSLNSSARPSARMVSQPRHSAAVNRQRQNSPERPLLALDARRGGRSAQRLSDHFGVFCAGERLTNRPASVFVAPDFP